MSRIERLTAELEHETRTTRRHLVRVPEDRLEWRPHPKSSTAGGLASHLVDCIRFAEPVFAADEYAIDPSAYAPFRATTGPALLEAFDTGVARALDALARSDDADAVGPWRLLIGGRVRWVRPREEAFRDLTLSHLIHHRGQLTVYLRLMDVPVAGTYGPTADER